MTGFARLAYVLITLASVCLAQSPGITVATIGVPGLNDLTVNGQGSGQASCVVRQFTAGSFPYAAADALPGSPVIAGIADQCAPGALFIDSTFSIDLDIATLMFVLDGTGSVIPANGLTSFSVTDATGFFAFTGVLLLPRHFAMQWGFVNPAYPTGFGTSQAFDLTLAAMNLFPVSIGNDLLPLSNDGSVNLSFSNPAGFSFYGAAYTDMFVNMNGNVTFVSGDSDFTATEQEMISGQPRIAPAWDDWNPADPGQGTVRAQDDGVTCVIEWHDVPHSGPACQSIAGSSQDSNTFGVQLHYATGEIRFLYGGMARCATGGAFSSDTVVGISPGWGFSPANNIDLFPQGSGFFVLPLFAIYEDFSMGTPWDLSGLSMAPQSLALSFMPASGPFVGGYTQSVTP